MVVDFFPFLVVVGVAAEANGAVIGRFFGEARDDTLWFSMSVVLERRDLVGSTFGGSSMSVVLDRRGFLGSTAFVVTGRCFVGVAGE